MRKRALIIMLASTLLACEPALAATWVEADVTALQGSLVEGDGEYLELPWTVIWDLGSIIPGAALDPRAVERLKNGNTLVTSRDTRGVYEVTTDGTIAWSYTSDDDPDLWPFHATRLANGNTLVVDRWQETVLEVTPLGDMVWRYGVPDKPMDPSDPGYQRNDDLEQPDPGELIDPFTAFRLPNGNTLIAENQACRVIEVRSSDYDPDAPDDGYTDSSIVWQCGVTHEPASEHGYADGYLDWPKWAVRLDNGNTLIADDTGQRVIEVSPAGSVVWQYGRSGVPGSGPGLLNEPVAAERLDDGSTLITDSKNNRILRVDVNGTILWEIGEPYQYGLDADGLAEPRRATITDEGTLLVADSSHHRVVELGYADSGLVTSGRIDCGLPGVRKAFSSLAAVVETPEGTGYELSYSLDGGPWRSFTGTDLPDGTCGTFLQYRVRLSTGRHDASPRLMGVSLSYEPAPEDQDAGGGGDSGTASGSGSSSSAAGTSGRGDSATTGGGDSGVGGGYGSVAKSAGKGYTSGEIPIDTGATSREAEPHRGWALTQVDDGAPSSGPPAAPSQELLGLLLLGTAYLTGALSVPLTALIQRWRS